MLYDESTADRSKWSLGVKQRNKSRIPVGCVPLELDDWSEHVDGDWSARLARLVPRVLGADRRRGGAKLSQSRLVLGRYAKLVVVTLEQIRNGTRQPRDRFLVDPDPPAARGLTFKVVPGHRRAAVAEWRLIRHRAAGTQHFAH